MGIDSFEQKTQKMISILNVRDTKNGEPGAFRLLTCTSLPKAKKMVEQFQEKNKERHAQIEWATEEVRMRIFHKKTEPVVFEGDNKFEYMLLGAVASIISNETNKPAFIYKKSKKGLLGSVRAPAGYDTVKAMQACDAYLDVYGGHAQASGFETTGEHEEELRVCLTEYFKENK
jgi:single-stranded DNA-specific DHH superfamily exonuclease